MTIDVTNPQQVFEEAQRRTARRANGLPLSEAPPPPDVPIAEADLQWQAMQRAVYRVFKAAGCDVYWLSQARATGQTPGIPDLLIFGPPGAPFMAWWESKAGRGKLSPAQQAFQRQCQRCGIRFGSGGANGAKKTLGDWINAFTTETTGHAASRTNR